jgi:outer membrane protein assembly factor BamB
MGRCIAPTTANQGLPLATCGARSITRKMSPRRLLPLVATLFAIALGHGVEPIVATPFDVRHDANELLDDLKVHRGEPGALLERVQNLLAAHGDSMIANGDLCAPLAELFAIKLADLGLAESFAKTYSGIAERRLREAVAAHANESELRALALSYPGTKAAIDAWRRLADLAWDTGRLGLFLDYAHRANETTDKPLSARMAAAKTLLTPEQAIELPDSLDGLEEMWRIDITEPTAAAVQPDKNALTSRTRRGRRVQQTGVPRYSLTTSADELTAASDGQKMFIFDHLIGRLIGEVRILGNDPIGSIAARPVVTRSGFIGLGWADDKVVLMCLDRLGEVKWRLCSPSLGQGSVISAPVVLDNLVVFAALSTGNQEGAELRALAFRTDTGRPVWNTLISRIPFSQQMMFFGSDGGFTAPALAIQSGSLVVLSNSGLIARMGIDGNVSRLWSYPNMGEELDNELGNGTPSTRRGTMVSDGTFVVASPSDSPGTILFWGPQDRAPRRFQGDGANGEVLDLVSGNALLAGTRNLSLFDTVSCKIRWAVPFAGHTGVEGRLGAGRVLVSTNEQLALVDRNNGHIVGSRGLNSGRSLAVTTDLVMEASNERITGWGRGASFLERLTKAAAANPADFRPWGTLASYRESRDERDLAFSCLIEALSRGATADYAERAARLVRNQLELSTGDDKAFPGPLAKLQSLTMYDDRLKGEIALWRGRHAELKNDKAAAMTAFQTALTFPDHRMLLKDRIEARVHILATNGVMRLKENQPATTVTAVRKPLPAATTPWNSSSTRGEATLVGGGLAVGFSDGFLSATKVSDGTLAWRRQPIQQRLGVVGSSMANAENDDGIPIQQVISGSSADAAKMKSGDVLLSFQGQKTTNFNRDLKAVVATMTPGMPFTMTVQRSGAVIELKGWLGGEPVEPLAINDQTLLLWLSNPIGASLPQARQFPQLQPTAPEGMWFAAVDLATGTELFRYAIRPTNLIGDAPRPILTDNDFILTHEGSEVVCLKAHGNKAGEDPVPLWRLPLSEESMAQMRVISGDTIWLPEEGRNRVSLVDLKTGVIKFILPEDQAAEPVLVGNTCFCLGHEGRVTCWDLGIARQRWRTAKVYGRLHGVSGDGVYVTDENNQLVILDTFSGDVRRRYGEWSTIESVIRGPETLSLFVRHADRSQALVRIGLAGGNVQWEQPLPFGVEVHQLIESPDAFGAVLFEGTDMRTLILVGKDGAIRSAQALNGVEKIIPINGGLLAHGINGMRVLPNQLAKAPVAVPCQALDGESDLTKLANQALPLLKWQTAGSASYALARHQGSLLLFAKIGADSKNFTIRIGDGDPSVDTAGQMATFTAANPQFATSANKGGWTLDGTKRISAEGQPAMFIMRLQPSPDRVAGSLLAVRAECDGVTDVAPQSANVPWWLRRAWRSVTGGP